MLDLDDFLLNLVSQRHDQLIVLRLDDGGVETLHEVEQKLGDDFGVGREVI